MNHWSKISNGTTSFLKRFSLTFIASPSICFYAPCWVMVATLDPPPTPQSSPTAVARPPLAVVALWRLAPTTPASTWRRNSKTHRFEILQESHHCPPLQLAWVNVLATHCLLRCREHAVSYDGDLTTLREL